MDQPFFTVIIPTYNRAELIRRPIESVIAQTFDSWELIIVDDGSTDNTEQVVKSYPDVRIRYIFQQNQERSAARNTGIKNSRGQYICFLDSDDYYLPEHLASFHQKIASENFPVAVLYCDTYEDCDGIMTLHKTTPIQARNPVEQVVQMIIGAPRTCVHRQILEKHQFNPALSVGEDIDLWARALKEYPLIFNDAATVVFVTHKGRTVKMGNLANFKANALVMEKIFSEDKEMLIARDVRKKVLSKIWFRLAQHSEYRGEKWKAAYAYFRSLIISPSSRSKEKIYLIMQQFFLTRKILGFNKSLFKNPAGEK